MIRRWQAIVWTDIHGNKTEVSVSEDDETVSFEDIRKEAIKNAKFLGWYNPKWYEFWRWNDTKFKFDKKGELKNE